MDIVIQQDGCVPDSAGTAPNIPAPLSPPPPEDTPIRSVDDLKSLRRWIPIKGSIPAKDNNGRCATFSHRAVGCGGFENGQTAEEFVREGGACLNHSSGAKTVARFESTGWYMRAELEGRSGQQVSFCFSYEDAPPFLLVHIELPPQPSQKCMEMRQGLVTWLNDRGCPVSVSDKPENRVAAFLVSNPDHHGGLKHIWHGEGIVVSAYTPRSPEHAPLHDLDGNLPTLDATDFDEWMSEAEFRLVKPSDENGTRRSARGSYFDDNFEPNEYGAAFAQTIADRWAFDYDHGGYHRWNGLHWRNLVDRDAEDILWDEVIDSEPVKATRRSLEHSREAVLKAVRRGIGREMPLLAGEWLATGNQMVNLRTSEFRPFDPSIDHHRAVTGGCYRDDWQDEHCWSILWGRYTFGELHLVDREGLGALVELIGLSLTGRAQKHRSITFLYGDSGSGKGGTLRLVGSTLGGRAMAVGASWLSGRGSEIDATGVKLIRNCMLAAIIGELRRADQDRMLDLSGDGDISGRDPYGRLMSGHPVFMIWIATTSAPRMDFDSGFGRRIAVIRFPHKDAIPNDQRQDPTQDEMDALLTLAVRAAKAVYEKGYTPPVGNAEALAEFQSMADPLQAWIAELHSSDDLVGRSLASLADGFNDDDGKKIAPQTLANKLRTLGYETTPVRVKSKNDNIDGTARIVHRAPPTLEQLDEWRRDEVSRLLAKGSAGRRSMEPAQLDYDSLSGPPANVTVPAPPSPN